jgi:hypothetical protein
MRDGAYVREQYASERNLAARSSLYVDPTGPLAGDVAFDAIAEDSPRRVLEVSCGTGWFVAFVDDVQQLPDPMEAFVAKRSNVVFVATK